MSIFTSGSFSRGTPLRGSPGVATIGGIDDRSMSKVAQYVAPGSARTIRRLTSAASAPRCLTR